MRRKTIKPVKDSITGFVKGFNLNAQNPEKAGRNESTQYVYYIEYDSVVLNRKETVKLEIGLRFNPVLAPQKHGIKHKFIHPFTKEPLFSGGETACLQLDELVAEKMRAAATRQVIASRDFFDLGYLIETGFDLSRKAVLDILKIKLAEDGFPVDMRKYSFNLGRTEKEIDEMKSHVEDELLSVLSVNERNRFDMQKVLDALNNVFKTVV